MKHEQGKGTGEENDPDYNVPVAGYTLLLLHFRLLCYHHHKTINYRDEKQGVWRVESSGTPKYFPSQKKLDYQKSSL